MNMQQRRSAYPSSELFPITPPPSLPRKRHYYSGDHHVVLPPQAPIIIGGPHFIGDRLHRQIRHPFDRGDEHIMSEPEPISVHENDVLMGR